MGLSPCKAVGRRHLYCERLRHHPHSHVSPAGDRPIEAHDLRKVPPIIVALVPRERRALSRFALQHQIVPPAHGIVARPHNRPRPRLHVAPSRNRLERHFRQRPRSPLHEVAILFLAKRLRTPHSTTSLPHLRTHAPILDPLDAQHDENRIRPRTSKGVSNHQNHTLFPCVPMSILNEGSVSHSSMIWL